MMQHFARENLSRRQFGKRALGAAAAWGLASPIVGHTAAVADDGKTPRPLRVACITTVFHYRSHSHNIIENFLEPYLFRGKLVQPHFNVVSLFIDQFPANDIGKKVAADYRIPLCQSIEEALCIGGNKLSVDAVLLIGEHGDYPMTDLGQTMYPRKKFFDEIVAVMKRDGKPIPVFNDKHLSYRWDWAKEMYDTAREMKFALHAGSSVPLAHKIPAIHPVNDVQIDEAVAVHGGGAESYDFHALEVLQSMIEGRRGAETGIESVEFLEREALAAKARQGAWSWKLAHAAMATEANVKTPDLRSLIEQAPHGILLRYKDGTRGTVLKVGSSAVRWAFAAQVRGEDQPRATFFNSGSWGNRGLFRALSHSIQHTFTHGSVPYPLERTLLTTGVLAAAMQSRHEEKAIETPHLVFRYAPQNFEAMCENGETWKIIPPGSPQPTGIKRDTLP